VKERSRELPELRQDPSSCSPRNLKRGDGIANIISAESVRGQTFQAALPSAAQLMANPEADNPEADDAGEAEGEGWCDAAVEGRNVRAGVAAKE
jgi:hypothetical protein